MFQLAHVVAIYLAYVYPKNFKEDGRRWFVALSCEKSQRIHNHPPPLEWKILAHIIQDITQAISRNIHTSPKDIQNGRGLDEGWITNQWKPPELLQMLVALDQL